MRRRASALGRATGLRGTFVWSSGPQRSGRKNARMSSASSAGCSMAAKWPPFEHRRPMHDVEHGSPPARGGSGISLGNSSHADGRRHAVRRRQAEAAVLAGFVVEARRGGDRSRPVEHHVVQQLVAPETGARSRRSGRSHNRSRSRNFSTIHAARPTGESVRPKPRVCGFVALLVIVAALAVPPGPQPGEIVARDPVLGRLVDCAAEEEAPGDEVQVDAGDALRLREAELERDRRSPVAALGAEAFVAKRRHEARPEAGDPMGVIPRSRAGVRKADAGQGRNDDVERIRRVAAMRRRVGQQGKNAPHLDEAARPAMADDERKRPRPLPR